MGNGEKKRSDWKKRLKHLVWEQNPAEMTWGRRTLLRQLQMVVLVVRDFGVNQCLLRAAALTYYTMLSLVPLLALTFALLKAFGVQNQLQPLIMDKLNVGGGEVTETIISYINNTQVAQLGAVGLVFLIVAVVSLLTNVEKAFNYVWGVSEVRPLLRRFSDYLSVILVGPILLISAISMSSTLLNHGLMQQLMEMQLIGSMIVLLLKIAPFVFMWLAFTGLYIFMSNIKVQWRAAFIGGIAGGTLWQLAQLGYVHFQVGVARHNAIYGTMAALPVFMVWLYVSWIIVLFGLGVCYAKQNLRTGARDLRSTEISVSSFEQVALALLVTLADRFIKAEPPATHDQLARILYIPSRLCRGVLEQLETAGFVSQGHTHSGISTFQLGRSADTLKIADILEKLRGLGEEVLYLSEQPQTKAALATCQDIDRLVRSQYGEVTLKELVHRSGQMPAPEQVEQTATPELT